NVRNTGSLVINKTTTGGTGTFTFVVNCSEDAFDQAVTIVDSGSQTITGIPTGTTCTVAENAATGFTSTVTTGSSPVTIGSGSNTIGFTNVRNTGSLVVNKTTTGGSGTFTFVVNCDGTDFDRTVTIVNSGSHTITGIPTGTVCSVTENAATGFTSTVTTGSSPVTIGSGNNTIGFTNVRNTGSLVVNKTTTGGSGTFTFVVDCDGILFDQTVTIVNSGSQTITGIPTGTVCSVTENAATGFTSTVTTGSSPVTIGSGNNAIGFTNVRNTGSLVVNKTTTGGTGTFTFVVDCSENAFDQTVTIVDSGSQTITGIPTGTTCTVVETPHPDFSSAITTGSSPISIGSGTTTVGFTNTALLPTLGVVKTADAASVSSGSPIGFTVTVSNSGPGTARNVTLNDPLPPAVGVSWSISPAYAGPGTCSISGTAPAQVLNCAFGNLAPGASAPVHVVSATTSATSGNLVNRATARADNNPPVDDDAEILINRPGLSVAKVADATSISSGSPIGFTVTVSNAGPGTATNVVLSDPLPSGTGISWSISPARAGCAVTGAVGSQVLSCTFGDMAPAATATVHVVSATTAATSGTFTNTATVRADNHEPVTAIANVVVNKPNLTITKAADAASVVAGNPIGFTVTVSNAGPGTATNVTVTDPLPGGTGIDWSISPATTGCSITGAAPTQTLTCTVASLASGASLAVHVVSATTAGTLGTFDNSATARADNHPAVTADATTMVLAPAVVAGVIIERAAPAVIAPAVILPAPAPPAPPAPAVAVAAAAPATLPRTGSDPLTLLFAGILLIATGVRFRRWGRRT
ncbi:MAG TPA: DUF11 domain-containing protein, partial [Acidimicrobiales bacterium]|nr:DUF11 domain-containing protein [Acidimicrobiales bacterium]